MPEPRHQRGLIDTSVVIDLPFVREEALPSDLAVSTITLVELSAGPHATDDPGERAARQHRLQQAEATFEAIPFDGEAARAYGRVYAAVVAGGKKARGRRALDMMIAATAVASDLPLYTSNPKDFEALDGLLEVVPVQRSSRRGTGR